MKFAGIFSVLIIITFCLSGQISFNNIVSADATSINLIAARSENPENSGSHEIITSAGSIKFPNAFRWNHAGPTGGYWNENQTDDFVFRPFYSNVTSYRLQIFNRNGALIYESSEIHKGWDGYFENGSLVSQGVYIWMVSGKFIDGSAFKKIGDVTFIY